MMNLPRQRLLSAGRRGIWPVNRRRPIPPASRTSLRPAIDFSMTCFQIQPGSPRCGQNTPLKLAQFALLLYVGERSCFVY